MAGSIYSIMPNLPEPNHQSVSSPNQISPLLLPSNNVSVIVAVSCALHRHLILHIEPLHQIYLSAAIPLVNCPPTRPLPYSSVSIALFSLLLPHLHLPCNYH